MTADPRIATLSAGYVYPECPRWHAGRLWFSDQYGLTVHSLTVDGVASQVARVSGRPSGLGWGRDGHLLVVSMLDHALLKAVDGRLSPVASFEDHHTGPSNDMIVSSSGAAFVGNIGFDFYGGEPARNTVLTRVDPDGSVHVAADDLNVPNGMVFRDRERELIVAESFGHRLTAFAVNEDWSLARREVFADLDGAIPDGICIDIEDAIWFASIERHEVVRVRRGGEILSRISTYPEQPYACALGGPRGSTLFICTARSDEPTVDGPRTGLILTVEVDVPAPINP